MASAIDEFFEELGRRGHEPLLAKATATVRFEITQGLCTEHWYVSITKGDLTVSRENLSATSVVRASRDLFDRAARGEENLLAAMLRGEVLVEGNPAVPMVFQRLLPGPHGPAVRQLATAGRGRRA